jgi:dienelactone hydrolase
MGARHEKQDEQEVRIDAGNVIVGGTLTVPVGARGIVLFAHGSGSSRFSLRNRYVAGELTRAGLATLLIDLLTDEEDAQDLRTRQHRFDIPLLAGRLVGATDWVAVQAQLHALPVGYFGASTGAAAALVAAASRPENISAVVSRGGRPDLASAALPRVRCPTLLIVGGNDVPVIAMNRSAMAQMTAPVELEIVPGATHLFEQPGTLERVAELAAGWFTRYISGPEIRGGSQP